MNARATSSQTQGQASFEALVIIVFGFLLVLGIHHIGQLHSHTLHLLGESHFLSFVPNRVSDAPYQSGASLTVNRETVAMPFLNEEPLQSRYASIRLGDSTYSATQLELENQLGFDSATLLRASAQSAPSLRSKLPALGLSAKVGLTRHSFLLSGHGEADSTLAAQAKIASSASLWQKSFTHSSQLVNHSVATLQSIDQAWGRASLTSSWLMPWANEGVESKSSGQTLTLPRTQAVFTTLGNPLK
ncbi:MAG: hypothetical protein K9J49_11425 [Candidatus Methylopumilus sp.]|nr:hypothetical protein [Candidatus Methylopumilus sp.]